MAIQNPLIVYNSSYAPSLVAALAYIGARNFPVNTIGINFGVTPNTIVTAANIGSFSVAANSFKVNGIVRNDYDGTPLTFLAASLGFDPTVPNFDAIFFAPYTPLVRTSAAYAFAYPFPAEFALNFGRLDANNVPRCGAGRIGCPALVSGGFFNMMQEMTCESGEALHDQAVANALMAEEKYNFDKLVLTTSEETSSFYGYDNAYNSSQTTIIKSSGLNVVTDLFLNYGLTTPGNLFGVPKLEFFGLAAPFSIQADIASNPGAHPYSNSYKVLPGAFSLHWFSVQYEWAMDALFKGASVAALTVAEPQADGVRNPFLMFQNLRTGVSASEAMKMTVNCYPTQVGGVAFERQVMVGDPAYQPYKVQSRQPGAGKLPFTF